MRKFKSYFSISKITPVPKAERDKYMSEASLREVREFLPDVDDANTDLLPVAFSAFVANRVNKNGDCVDTKTALAIHEKFINKQINIEHNRKNIVGFITNAGFSEFGSDKPISKEEIEARAEKGDLTPFNVVLGGYIWHVANDYLPEMIVESNDPGSVDFMRISASWEVSFSAFDVAEVDAGEKNLENAKMITNEDEIFAVWDHLKAFGGTGTNGDKDYHRVIVGEDVLPLGIGLTESPAADVEGVAAKMQGLENKTMAKAEGTTEVKSSEDNDLEKNDTEVEEPNEETSTQKTEETAKENKQSVKEIEMIEIRKSEDITDQRLKDGEITSVSIANWTRQSIKDAVKEASEQFEADKAAKAQELQTSQEKVTTLEKEVETLKASEKAVQESLKNTKAQLDAIAHANKLQERLAVISSKFELSEEQEKSLAKKVSAIATDDDEAFASFVTDLDLFLTKKEAKASGKKEEATASEKTVEESVENGEQKQEALASQSSEQSLTEKYAGAFKYGAKGDEDAGIFIDAR